MLELYLDLSGAIVMIVIGTSAVAILPISSLVSWKSAILSEQITIIMRVPIILSATNETIRHTLEEKKMP